MIILALLSVTYSLSFELGMIPNGAAAIYNEEFWSRKREEMYIPVVEFNPDRDNLVYYSVFGIRLRQSGFFVGGDIKTYAEKSEHSKSFSPYRARFLFKLGYEITKNIQLGFNHSCTHAFENMDNIGIFEGSYEEFYIRFTTEK